MYKIWNKHDTQNSSQCITYIIPVFFNFLIIVVRMDWSVVCQGMNFECLVEVAGLTESIPQCQCGLVSIWPFCVLPWGHIQTLTVLGGQVSIVVPILEDNIIQVSLQKLSTILIKISSADFLYKCKSSLKLK